MKIFIFVMISLVILLFGVLFILMVLAFVVTHAVDSVDEMKIVSRWMEVE